MTVGSLFAGIGGFDLGFTRAGFDVQWQVEIDPFCRAVLAKRWPQVRRYEDVRTTHVADAAHVRYGGWTPVECRRLSDEQDRHDDLRCESSGRGADHGCADCLAPVDVICGGFPCQPHSLAGRRAGADDERDLWPQFVRLIRELEPRWVVAENVPGLLSSDAGRFFGDILRDLAQIGYDAEWDCLPASAFGAPHRRDRVWLVAYPNDRNAERGSGQRSALWTTQGREGANDHAGGSGAVADPDEPGSQGRIGAGVCERAGEWPAGASSPRIFTTSAGQWREWEPESGFCRVAHGVPARVDRLRGLGNAIVPQIAEWIARQILAAEGAGR